MRPTSKNTRHSYKTRKKVGVNLDHFTIFNEFSKMNEINGNAKEIWKENNNLN